MRRFLALFFLIFLSACAPKKTLPSADRQVISVYADLFTERWLPTLYTCAERSPKLLVYRTQEIGSANLILRVTNDPQQDGTSYQIGESEFVIATNAQNAVKNISFTAIQNIYAGRFHHWTQLGGDDALIQLWVYPVETGLNATLIGDENLSSLAKQAQNPEALRVALESDIYAIGFLPREEIQSSNIQFLRLDYEFTFPIIATVFTDTPEIKNIVSCLQKKMQ